MNKEIKFRFWIIEENKMLYNKDIISCDPKLGFLQYDDQGYYIRQTSYSEKEKEERISKGETLIDDFIPMQFIGIKDINKKDIYEDDIVIWHYNEDNYIGILSASFICGILAKRIGRVNFRGKHNQSIYYSDKEWITYYDKMYDIEVIGNQYENPEFLIKKN